MASNDDKAEKTKTERKAPIHRASEKILNLATYQLGEEGMLAYKEKLEHANMRLHLSSNSEPLLSSHWYKDLPGHMRDKDVVLPILAYGILRPDHAEGSKNHYFGGMLHVIQANKDNNNLEGYFDSTTTCRGVCSTITSHWPLKSQIYQELKTWLLSEDIANIANNIDANRYDSAASNDLCEALELLHLHNQYVDCSQLTNQMDSSYKTKSERSKIFCEVLEVLNIENPYIDCIGWEL